jgi:hypothetical protein
MRNRIALAVAASMCLLLSSDTHGRIVEDWPYERLMKESDLVVLAKAVKTRAADDHFVNSLWPLEFVGQDTTFDVQLVMKGDLRDLPAGRLVVLHFKFGKPNEGVSPEEASIIINGPMLVTFRTEYVPIVKGNRWKPQYMLFLRRLKDGRCEAVSGRIDPAFSVREVFERGIAAEVDWRRSSDDR